MEKETEKYNFKESEEFNKMIHPDIIKKEIKEKYNDYSVEDLKAEYEKITKGKLSYETKEEQIKHDISKSNLARCTLKLDNRNGTLYMFEPIDVATSSALQELIKEKTGDYCHIEFKTFFYSIYELIDFVLQETNDPFWNTILRSFFDKLDDEKHLNPSAEQYEQEQKNLVEFHVLNLSDKEINELVEKYKQLYKIEFLLKLANDKVKFDKFLKELTSDYNVEELFEKYDTSFVSYKG